MNIWYRLCVDVDESGQPLGLSYERHLGEKKLLTVKVLLDTGPFDTSEDAFAALLAQIPRQGVLFA